MREKWFYKRSHLIKKVESIEITQLSTMLPYNQVKLSSLIVYPHFLTHPDGVVIIHYTKSGDHGPPHVHVKGGGAETRIGQNGKPLKNNPSLTTDQQSVVDDYRKDIRNAVKKNGAWFNYNQQ